MSEEPKKPDAKSRSRASAHADRFIIRAAKKLEKLASEFSDQDSAAAIARLRSQLNANKKMWDVNKKKMINIPDEKIRFDAAVMILAYKFGRPVERSVTANIPADSFPEMLERMRGSAVAQEKLGDSLQSALESKETVIEVEDSPSQTEPPAEQNSAEK